LRDVEKDYDNKLGFERSVKLLDDKKKKIEEELPEYQSSLQIQAAVGVSLFYIKSQGVTDSDIIGMNNLVHNFVNSNLLFSYADNGIVRADPWYFFIQEFTKVKDLKLEIKNLSALRDNLKKEITTSRVTEGLGEIGFLESAINRLTDTHFNQDDPKPN